MKSQGKTPYQAYAIAVGKSLEEGYLADIWSRKECVDVFAETYCYDAQLKYEGREEGREEGLELSAQIYVALKENIPIPTIADRFGVTVQQIEKLKEVLFTA